MRVGVEDVLDVDAVDELPRVRDEGDGEVLDGRRKTVHDRHARRLRVRLRLRNDGRVLYGFLERGALGVVHGHVLEHGVEEEGVPRDALPGLGDELGQAELVPGVDCGAIPYALPAYNHSK